MRLIILAAALITPFAAAAGDSLNSYDRTLPSEYQKTPQFRQNWRTSVSSYALKSSHASELFVEISEKSPRSGKDAGSITRASFSITWDLDTLQKKDFCEFYGAEVNVEVRFTIPEWSSPEATEEERRQWDSFLGKLNAYNEDNKKIVKDEIDRMGSSLVGLRPVKTCQELQQNADQIGGGYLGIISRKLSSFREETQGGRVYGLQYPVFSQTEYVNSETGEVIRKGDRARAGQGKPDAVRKQGSADERKTGESREEIERRESALVDEDDDAPNESRRASSAARAKAGDGKESRTVAAAASKAESPAKANAGKAQPAGKKEEGAAGKKDSVSAGKRGKAAEQKPWPQARPATETERKGSAGKDSRQAAQAKPRKDAAAPAPAAGAGKESAAAGVKKDNGSASAAAAPAAKTVTPKEEKSSAGSLKEPLHGKAQEAPAAGKASGEASGDAAARAQPQEQSAPAPEEYHAPLPAGRSTGTGRRQIIIRSGHKPITNYGSGPVGDIRTASPAKESGSQGRTDSGRKEGAAPAKGSGYDSSQLDRMFGGN